MKEDYGLHSGSKDETQKQMSDIHDKIKMVRDNILTVPQSISQTELAA